jgi:dephospho-CoA kinase
MIVIGFSGKAEHGKTTATNYICKNLKRGLKIETIPLAKKMKEQAKMLGWNGEKDTKGRRLLQEISWPIKHYFGEDIYAKWCLEKAQEDKLDVLLIDDVRMLAEVEFFKQAEMKKDIEKFVLIRINRPNHKSKLTKEQLKDVSETQLDNYEFDYYVENMGTIENFGEQVLEVVESVIQ